MLNSFIVIHLYHYIISFILPEPVSPCQAVPGLQDSILRRRAFPVLRPNQERSQRMPFHGLLLQGKVVPTEVQCLVYNDNAPVPATGVW